MDVEGTYESGPLSGGVRFEITVESHDAFDVYPIMQKWNSYRNVSRPYRGLPSILAEKFRGNYFRSTRQVCENRENYVRRKFGNLVCNLRLNYGIA